MSDGPFYEIAGEMEEQIAKGATCFQRFSCIACGAPRGDGVRVYARRLKRPRRTC